MKKLQVVIDSDSRFTPERVAKNNAKVRAQANLTVRGMMDEVQAAVDAENVNMEAQLEGENALRAWAKQLCGITLDMSEIENLRDIVTKMRNGQTQRFNPKRGGSVTLHKSSFGTIDRLENYIFSLEKTIIDLSQNKTPVPFNFTSIRILQFTDLGFFGLIKLAFKQLFNRRK